MLHPIARALYSVGGVGQSILTTIWVILLQVAHRETAKGSKESVEALQHWSEIGSMVCKEN